jgi:hypothetical protein
MSVFAVIDAVIDYALMANLHAMPLASLAGESL